MQLTPIEFENNLGPDVNGVVHRVPWKAYDIDEVDALLAEKDAEIRRLRRALFIAHAIKAKFKWWWMSECKHNESCKRFPDPHKIKKFTNSAWVCSKSQDKCRAKAEEYK